MLSFEVVPTYTNVADMPSAMAGFERIASAADEAMVEVLIEDFEQDPILTEVLGVFEPLDEDIIEEPSGLIADVVARALAA